MSRPGYTAIVAAVACALTPAAAQAGGGIAVSPVAIDFARGAKARALTISNPGDEPVDVQVRLFSWSVDETGDRHEPSQDIGFSPPMFHLAPGARQVVRLAAPPPPADRERAYRLFVDQLPKPAPTAQIQLPVRMVLPVFVAPAATTPTRAAQLRWRAERAPGGKLVLTAENGQARHVRLVNLAFQADGESHVVQAGLAGYVLAGQSRRWIAPYAGRGGTVTVTALTDDGPISVPVDLGGG